MMLKLAVVGLCLFLLVAPSFQYGTILVDTVNPVKNDAVLFNSARSDTAVFNELDVGSLSLSNPDGFLATPPGTAEFTGSTVDLHGELGVAIGNSGSDTELNASGTLTGLTQDLNINAENSFSVSTADDLTVSSGRSVSVTAQAMDLEGLFGFVVESRLGNIDVTSGVEIFAFSDALSINAVDTLSVDSVNEIDFTSAGHDMEFNAKRMNMLAIEEIELISEQDLTVTAEDAIHSYAGSSELTSLGDINFSSGSRNVDFTAADTTRVTGATINIDADDFVYLTATEYSQGRVNLWAEDEASIIADSATFFASNNVLVEDTAGHSIITTGAVFNADSELHFGTSITETISITDTDTLNFLVTDDVGEEFDVVANDALSMTGNVVDVNADGDILTNAANIALSAGSDIDVAGDTGILSALNHDNADIEFNLVDRFSAAAVDNVIFDTDDYVLSASTVTWSSGGSHTELVTLKYELSSEDATLTSTTDDAKILGSNLEISVSAFNFDATNTATISSDIGDITVETGSALFNYSNDVSFATSNDFLVFVAADDDDDVGEFDDRSISITAGQALTVSAVESADLIQYGQDTLFVEANAGALSFVNTNTDGEGESRFNAVDEVQFNGVGARTPATITANEVLFDAGGDLQLSTDDLTITASISVEFTTNTASGSLVLFDGDSTTLSSITSTSIESGGDVNFNFLANTFTNPVLTVTSFDRSSYTAAGDITIAGSFLTDTVNADNYFGTISIDSDNGLAFNAGPSFTVTSEAFGSQPGNIGFVSASSIASISTAGLTTSAVDGISYTGGAITHTNSDALTVNVADSMMVSAPSDGAFINLHAAQGSVDIDSVVGGIDIDADTWLSHSTDLSINGGLDVTFNAPDVTFRGRTLDVTAGRDYIVNADVIVIDSDNTEGTVDTTVGTDTTAVAEETVIFTSDGDITFDSQAAAGTGITVTTIDLAITAEQSAHIEADTGILNVLALNAEDDKITFKSGGHTAFLAETGNADILSEDLVSIKAGRSLQLQSFLEDGIDVTAELGDFVVRAGGASVYFEGSDFFNITADNPTTDTDTADINFEAANGISVETEIGGILFEAYSPVPNSPTDNILISSAGNHGDIVFDSTRSNIVTEAPLEVTFTSTDGSIDSQTFGDSAFASQSDMTFTVGGGEFDVNGYRGVQVTAGSDGFPSDLTWTSGGHFDAGANGVIDIRSVGPIAAGDVALALETQAGGMRFVTANTGDIRLTARNDQTFTGDNFFVTPATNDFYAETVGGSIDTFALTSGNFSTQGGPIQMITTTGSLGGAITLDALLADITFTSGGAGFFSAEESIALQAETGISLLSRDGRLTIAAEASTSNIEMLASNEISLVSVGTRYSDPQDGISFDAANNVEFGTTATQRISFNSVNLFQIGEHTRPIVDINAGGSSTQDGFVINSIGGIFVQSNNTLELSVTDDFEVTAENAVTGTSGGPMLISSEQDMLLRSLLGVLRLSGDNLDMQATASIEGTSSGVFSVGSTGRLPSHGVSLQAPLVEFSAGGGMEWISHVVNGDVDETFTITATGDALIKGFSESGSDTSISFDANSALLFQSRSDLAIRSRDRAGAIAFSTQDATNGDLFITTQVASDIEFNAGNEMGIHSFGPATITSNNSKITLDANDTDPADDGSRGDIEILATGDITATATRNTLWTGEASVTIQTTATEEDVGGPLSFSSTGEMSITSTLDMTIENTLNEGGSTTFTAQSNLEVETFDDEGSIIFDSDLDTTFTAARDIDYTTDSDMLGNIGEEVAITGNGIHPSNDYGVFINAEGDDIEFRALFGALTFFGRDGVEIEATDFDIEADTAISMVGNTGASIAAEGGDISFVAAEARVEFKGNQGFTVATPTTLDFSAAGIDDLSNHGIAFSSAGRLEVEAFEVDTTGVQGLYISGSAVDIDAQETITVDAEDGHMLIDATDYVSFFANDELSIEAGENIVMRSGGYLFVDSDASVDLSANSMLLQATGTDAGVKGFAAGALSFDASNQFYVYSDETPGSDVNITTTLGEMVIDAADTALVTASAGNLVFTAPADDGDFYITADDDIDIETGGSVSFTSNFFSPTANILGLEIDVGSTFGISSTNDVSFTAVEDLVFDADDDIDINCNQGIGLGGDIVVKAGNDIFSDGTTLDIRSRKERGTINIISMTDDIDMDARVTEITSGFVKLPYRNHPGRNRNNDVTCRPGEVFITNFNHQLLQTQGGVVVEQPQLTTGTTDSMLCICENFAYFSTTSGSAATRPVCVPFGQPPCDRYLDPFCPLFAQGYVNLPSN